MNKLLTTVTGTIKTPGGIIVDRKQQQGNSLLRNFAHWMAAYLLAKVTADGLAITDISGTSRTFNLTSSTTARTAWFTAIGGSGASDKGLQVGSGTNPVTFLDTALQTLISTLTLSSVTGPNPEPITDGLRVKLFRTFTNNTAGGITVNEAGIVAGILVDDPATANYRKVLVARDVIGPYVIPVSLSLDLEYQIDILLT